MNITKPTRTFYVLCCVAGVILMLAASLRLWHLSSIPPSPYWEEAALGYDAYSIFKTGKDHHGNVFPFVALESFGDWKPALYAYAIIPFLTVFDLSVLAVRLPAALAGILLVAAIMLLAWQMKLSWRWAGLAAALSPWLILFSRAGWEVMLATTLIAWGVSVFIWAATVERNLIKFVLMTLSSVLLAASAYTYHSARVVAPLLALGLCVWMAAELRLSSTSKFRNYYRKLTPALYMFTLTIVCMIPILIVMRTPVVSQRALETSFFNSEQILDYSVEAQKYGSIPWVDRKLFNPYLLYARHAGEQFLAHFNPSFLFIHGDTNLRHSTGFTAIFYWFDAFLLLIGAYVFLKERKPIHWLLLWWLIIGILPISLTKDAPHALRLLITAPVWMLLLGTGYNELSNWITQRLLKINIFRHQMRKFAAKIAAASLIVILLIQFATFWRYYTSVYPISAAAEWQYGYAVLIAKINDFLLKHPDGSVSISRGDGRPLMYYFFYSKTGPSLVQEIAATAPKDQGEILTFHNIYSEPNLPITNSSLVVRLDGEASPSGIPEVGTIQLPNGSTKWRIYEK